MGGLDSSANTPLPVGFRGMAARVLLIDDDPHLLSALRRQLGERFDLTTAASGAEAIALVTDSLHRCTAFAVTLCDMRMPGMDGIETLGHIRALSPETVCLMLTGDADQRTAAEAINSDLIFRFYAKPCDSAHLAEGIAAAIRQHSLVRAERRLVENEERWRLALQAVGDGVWDWYPATGVTVFSEGWARMLGVAAADVAPEISAWWDRVHGDDAAELTAEIGRLLTGEIADFRHEHRLRRGDGSYGWFLARGTVLYRDEAGAALRVIGTHADISERRKMEESLRIMATTDALTGLWNRRCFLEKAEEELLRSERYGHPVALVMVDIDFFKKVNDTWGHEAGDVVLRHVADGLRRNLRKTDFIGRLGGEEFAVLLPEADGPQALVAAEALRRETAALSIGLADGRVVQVTASFGVASAGVGDNVADVLRRADEALYQAKHDGRNRVICWSQDVEQG
jgi:diguanylate cyclase (GGDEF)-like protein/PAS domain S-box-containing protein